MSLHRDTLLLSSQYVPFTFTGIDRARGIAYRRHKQPSGQITLTQEFVDLILPRQSRQKPTVTVCLVGKDPFIVSSDQEFIRQSDLAIIPAKSLMPGDQLLGLRSLINDGELYIVEGIKNHNDMRLSHQLLDVVSVRYRNYALSSGVFVHQSTHLWA